MANFPYPCNYRIYHSTLSEHKFKQRNKITGLKLGSQSVGPRAWDPEWEARSCSQWKRGPWHRACEFLKQMSTCIRNEEDASSSTASPFPHFIQCVRYHRKAWKFLGLGCPILPSLWRKVLGVFFSIIVMIQKIKFKNLVLHIWSLIISNGQWILRMIYLYCMEQTNHVPTVSQLYNVPLYYCCR